jgi:hypothetical protein
MTRSIDHYQLDAIAWATGPFAQWFSRKCDSTASLSHGPRH